MSTNTPFVIDAVFSFANRRAKQGEGFRLNTLRKAVVKQVGVVPNATITRALRALREEGSLKYTYNTDTEVYRPVQA